jgi:hypothetical protein
VLIIWWWLEAGVVEVQLVAVAVQVVFVLVQAFQYPLELTTR